MTLTTGQAALTFACPTCKRASGSRCVTASGAATPPHIQRWRLGEGYVSRQGEVDGLGRQIALSNEEIDRLDDNLAAAHDEITHWFDQLTAAKQALVLSDNTARDLAEQLKTARAGAALVPGLQARVAELMARVAELEAPPVVEPTRLPFGIGAVEKAASSAFPMLFTHTQLEQAAGVTFAYLHEYFRFAATGAHTGAIAWCEAQFKAGRVPIATFKLPGDDWAGAAAGKYDAGIKATFDAIEALAVKYNSRAIVATHHEPNNGDGPLATYLAMTKHLLPITKRPGRIEYWINLTGYMQLFQTTDWTLDAVYIEGIDGYAFNPYLSLGDTSTKVTSQRTAYYEKFAAWAKAKGVQWGIWETGINEKAAVTTLAGVSTWITDNAAAAADLGATMWIYWNNRVDADHPDWRISKTLPANKYEQILTAMRRWARK